MRCALSRALSLSGGYFALTLLFYAFFAGDFFCTLLILFAAAIHELGHILAARMLGIGIRGLRIDLVGALIVTDGLHSYEDEAMLCAAGPFFNLCAFLALNPLALLLQSSSANPFVLHYIEYFRDANLCLMVINLLPLKSFDGGRILFSLLSKYAGPRIAYAITSTLTVAFICLLWTLSVYSVIKYQSALSLFTFSAMLFVRLLWKEGY